MAPDQSSNQQHRVCVVVDTRSVFPDRVGRRRYRRVLYQWQNPPNIRHSVRVALTLTVESIRRFLDDCEPTDPVVVWATLADGTVLGVSDLSVGTGQGGPDGEGVEVVIDWEPGAEVVTRP